MSGSIIRSTRNLSISVSPPLSCTMIFLAALTRQIANDERHALEDLTDLDHAHAHDTLAQISQLPAHAQTCFLERTPEWRAASHVSAPSVDLRAVCD